MTTTSKPISEQVDTIINRAVEDHEVMAEDVSDTLDALGIFNEKSRMLVNTKVTNLLDSIMTARLAVSAFHDDPPNAYHNYIGNDEGRYQSGSVDLYIEAFETQAANDFTFLVGLQAFRDQ